MKPLLIAGALIFIFGLASAQKQGIEGRVEWTDGNQMPGINKNQSSRGVQREVYIFKPVSHQSLKLKDGLYPEVNGKLVKVVKTKPDGTFRVKLPKGDYSILIKESAGYFGNIFDSNGIVNPVSVKKRKFTPITIKVNYKAFY